MLDCLRSNPWRKPSWRWLRAGGIISGEQPGATARRDGEDGYAWIRRCVAFRRAEAICRNNETSRMQLAFEDPAMFWATWLYETEHPARWIIEARVMARQTPREIAFFSGCGVEIIEAFEAVFFDIRALLDRQDYVNTVIFGDSVHRGVTEREYDILWKMFAYACGPHALNALVNKLVVNNWISRADGVPNSLQETAVNIMKKKAAISALTVPITSATQLHLLEAFVKYVEVERTTADDGRGQNVILANLAAMMSALPFNVARMNARMEGEIGDYDRSAVELDSNELMLVAAGVPLNNRKLLLDMKFPDPPAIAAPQEADKK